VNDPTPYIARLGLARDQLAEARRYVRTRPQTARKTLAGVTHVFHECWEMTWGLEQVEITRHWANVNAVRSAVGVDPDASCGGIDLVLHELALLMGNLRREWELEDRDRELTEAYGR
jgi:alkylation response protein AidB-like acyl-CoA dehydrogenase